MRLGCPGYVLPCSLSLCVAMSVSDSRRRALFQATLVIFLSMFLITDLLFLDSSQFQYNPDYKVSVHKWPAIVFRELYSD